MIKKIVIFITCFLLGAIFHGWAALALYYCSFKSIPWLRAPIAGIYLLVILLWIILNKRHMQAFFISISAFFIVAFWFSTIQPRTGGHFPPELTLAYADFTDASVVVHNVRNSVYRTKDDFDLRFETRAYNLNELKTVDVLVNYWGMDAIAHTFLSFGFEDGSYLAVSVEIRPEVGQSYDMLQGFFKQYQLIYIWGDERDLVRLRTNYKNENVYLYRSTLSAENVRKLFLSMLKETNAVYQRPQFYNTLTQSCTNTLGNHLIAAGIMDVPFWKRRFLTGDVDQRLYKEGLLVGNIPFADLRKEANIDERAQKADKDSQFSQRIRTHMIEISTQ